MTHDSVMPQPGPVSCEMFEADASAMLDGEVEGAMLVALQAHRASCDSCSALFTELAAIKRSAATLPTLAPPRDLWDGIVERIAAPIAPLAALPVAAARVATEPHGRLAVWFRRPWLAAAAALLLVASSAAVTYRVMSPSGPSQSATATTTASQPSQPTSGAPYAGDSVQTPSPAVIAPSPAGSESPARLATNRNGRSALPDVAGAYAPEIDRMRILLDQRRAGLDTSTVRVLETNLRIIDRAIQESRAALARDPASGLLNRQLSEALGQKLELMRTAVQLSSGA